jgi:hypothetical protein
MLIRLALIVFEPSQRVKPFLFKADAGWSAGRTNSATKIARCVPGVAIALWFRVVSGRCINIVMGCFVAEVKVMLLLSRC